MVEPESFPVPSVVHRVLDELSRRAQPLIAGGAVRDWLLGESGKDLDVEVFGLPWDRLITVLEKHGRVDLVGKSFGVAKFTADGTEVDFSLPRSEVKTAKGHRGFAVVPDPDLSPERAALRRDYTINAISFDWKNHRIVDPLSGQRDLRGRVLRHSSPAFVEDPLRVLRGFQFCSRFELTPAGDTLDLCASIKAGYEELPRERVWMEWEKWALRSVKPSLGLRFLCSCGWMEHFPEIFALVDCPQDPDWHPEGDVFNHTGHCLDALVRSEAFQTSGRFERLVLMFAVLTHDFGKPSTTVRAVKRGRERWISPAHDRAGMPLAETFLRSVGAPHALIPPVQSLVGNHMASVHIRERPSLPQVRRLARRLAPANLDQLFAVVRADQAGRPPLPSEPTQGLLWLEELAAEEALHAAAPKPLVRGRHLMEHGLEPGVHFKTILDALFELQLDGAFSTLQEAEPFIRKLCDRDVT